MPWFAIIDKSTGRLQSIGTRVAPKLPTTLEVRALNGKPIEGEMWDEATREFILRPPKVIIDRVDDIMNDPSLPPLSTAQKTALRKVIGRIMGSARRRSIHEPPEWGTGRGWGL